MLKALKRKHFQSKDQVSKAAIIMTRVDFCINPQHEQGGSRKHGPRQPRKEEGTGPSHHPVVHRGLPSGSQPNPAIKAICGGTSCDG